MHAGYGYWFIEALILHDLNTQVLTPAGSGAEGDRRLAAVTSQMVAPLDDLLGARHAGWREMTPLPEAADRSSALRAELTPLTIKALKRRALAAGMGSDAVEDVDDADDPREAIIEILLNAAEQASASSNSTEMLRAELAPLKMKMLKQRALAAGVQPDVIEDVDDADDPREAIIEILIAVEATTTGSADGMVQEVQAAAQQEEVLRAELAPLKMKMLKQRALAAGVQPDVIEDVDDADDPREAIIEILIVVEATTTGSEFVRSTAEPEPELSPAVADPDELVRVAELRTELQAMRLTALHKRAAAEGLDEDAVEDALEAEIPKAALMELLIKHAASKGPTDRVLALRQELEGLRLTALQQRAEQEGVDAAAVEDAMDTDAPKSALITLLAAHLALATNADRNRQQKLREELEQLKLSELNKRAMHISVDETTLEDAMDSDDPRGSLIALLLLQPTSGGKLEERQNRPRLA
jgi:hypothetical protein